MESDANSRGVEHHNHDVIGCEGQFKVGFTITERMNSVVSLGVVVERVELEGCSDPHYVFMFRVPVSAYCITTSIQPFIIMYDRP